MVRASHNGTIDRLHDWYNGRAVIGESKPRETEFHQEDVGAVDMTPWKHARAAGMMLILLISTIYITFADFSVLVPSGS
jgi:SSS family solute:Na+ symporter